MKKEAEQDHDGLALTVPFSNKRSFGNAGLPAQDAAAFVEKDALKVHLELFGTG